MELDEYIRKRKELYDVVLNFIEIPDDSNTEFQKIVEILKKQDILSDKNQILEILHLIFKIGDNHCRTNDLFTKLEKIIQYILQSLEDPVSSIEVYKIFKKNKLLLLYLIKNKLLKVEEIIKYIYKDHELRIYLYPFIIYCIDCNFEREIKKIFSIFIKKIENFEEKCQIGENISYICSLIRNDSISEFISYVSKANISLSSTLSPSIFETNSFFKYKEVTLIEYAAFYGSIQIVKYLQHNNISLNGSLWLYAVHSKNDEMIYFLEENHVEPVGNNYDKVLKEAIKCHHNDIANYIIDKYYQSDLYKLNKTFGSCITNSQNYYFFPDNASDFIFKSRNKNTFNISDTFFQFTTIKIPSSLTSIGNNVFRGCSSLIELIIPSSVTIIGHSAFSECSSLVKIVIPS